MNFFSVKFFKSILCNSSISKKTIWNLMFTLYCYVCINMKFALTSSTSQTFVSCAAKHCSKHESYNSNINQVLEYLIKIRNISDKIMSKCLYNYAQDFENFLFDVMAQALEQFSRFECFIHQTRYCHSSIETSRQKTCCVHCRELDVLNNTSDIYSWRYQEI